MSSPCPVSSPARSTHTRSSQNAGQLGRLLLAVRAAIAHRSTFARGAATFLGLLSEPVPDRPAGCLPAGQQVLGVAGGAFTAASSPSIQSDPQPAAGSIPRSRAGRDARIAGRTRPVDVAPRKLRETGAGRGWPAGCPAAARTAKWPRRPRRPRGQLSGTSISALAPSAPEAESMSAASRKNGWTRLCHVSASAPASSIRGISARSRRSDPGDRDELRQPFVVPPRPAHSRGEHGDHQPDDFREEAGSAVSPGGGSGPKTGPSIR